MNTTKGMVFNMKSKKIVSLILVFIFISTLFSSCGDAIPGNNISIDINDESVSDIYLKEERKFEFKSVGYGYDNCFFISNEEDNGYFYMENVVTKEKTKVLEKHVVTCFSYEEYLYCILENNSIIRILYTGEDETLIFEGESEISRLYVDGYNDIRVLYFMMNNTCYRYFINEKILDKLFYHENTYYFIPISNYEIEWSYLTPEWLKYLEETGDSDNGNYMKVTNIMSYDVLSKQSTEIDNFTSNIVNENDEDKEVPPTIIITTNPS